MHENCAKVSEVSDNRYLYNSGLVANPHANKNKHAKLWKTSKTNETKQNKTKKNKTKQKQKMKDKINRDNEKERRQEDNC